jgi:hypothetical protein
MMHQPQPVATPAITQADVRRLAAELVDVMDALLKVVEQETELVRAGKIADGMALDVKKTELSRHYVGIVSTLKANRDYLKSTSPDLLATLHRHHDVFRAMLQMNLTVLATAHAAPQYSADLYRERPARGAEPAPLHSARGQPFALVVADDTSAAQSRDAAVRCEIA